MLARDVLGITQARGELAERLVTALLSGAPRVARLGDGRWTLLAEPEESPALDTCRFAIVDVETTGHAPARGGRITEIAVVGLENHEPRVVFHSLVNPGVPIPPFIAALTGITDAAVRDAPRFEDVADDLLGALAGAVFAAHHVRFDWTFVSAEVERARALVLYGPRVCTFRLARRLLPDAPRKNLTALAHYFGFETPARHRAVPDAIAAARILGRLLERGRERGARTLRDLVNAEAG